jgi:integrase
MSLFKRNKWYWMDDVVNGIRYRLPLKTTNWQEANRLEKEKLNEIAEGKAGSHGKSARQTLNIAADAFLEERQLHKAPKTYTTERERSRALRKFFGDLPLRRITAEHVIAYQKGRKTEGLANKTVNLEVALLRQILKRYKQWNRLADDVKMLPKATKPARVLTAEEKAHLLETSRSKPAWVVARCAAVLALNTTMRGCELKGLRRKNVDLFEKAITIDRNSTKTDAGARLIPLNRDAVLAMAELLQRCSLLGVTAPDHYLFPACENGIIDPTKPMKGWRSAWRTLTKAAGLIGLRFHDLRHQAITELLEKGLSDHTIMEIAGHVSKEMLAHYSHMRLNAKRAALELLESPLPDPKKTAPRSEGQRPN